MTLRLEVFGEPVPQGSIRAFTPKGWTRPVLTSDNKRLKPWRQAIVDAAREHLDERAPVDGAVEVYVVFFLSRPASAPKRVTEPAKRPDADKLLRATLDALTVAGCWHDDAQVILTVARKAFAGGVRDPRGPAGVPRAVIEVREATISASASMARLFGEASA